VLVAIVSVVTFLFLPSIEDPARSGANGLQTAAQVPYAVVGQPAPPGGKSLRIHINGQQYIWRYDYVGEKPLDSGRPVYAFTDMHVPINTTVTLKIYSSDVVHSWLIPKLGGKADATPGHTNETWFKISKPGVYYGQCAELCGENHADMRARVIALPVDEYQAWVEKQRIDILASQKALAAQRKAGLR
jgi:cytochrome c oxidase subunit II